MVHYSSPSPIDGLHFSGFIFLFIFLISFSYFCAEDNELTSLISLTSNDGTFGGHGTCK
ncbi:hypothetical protein SCIP_0824 [Scardovia inopinata JCM 12537]|nr:hypothetical protein SCIP_0824 [Scardovia inopinata JCM 12537]